MSYWDAEINAACKNAADPEPLAEQGWEAGESWSEVMVSETAPTLSFKRACKAFAELERLEVCILSCMCVFAAVCVLWF